jgi:hypothetical protein
MLGRRRALALAAAHTLTAGCKREVRCQHCGMKIDPASPWRAELVAPDGRRTPFDAPRCAFTVLRSGKAPGATLRVQEYYERQWRAADELRFAVGGDVLGPMGPDLVPIDPKWQTKFIQDHGADRTLKAEEVTPSVLAALK